MNKVVTTDGLTYIKGIRVYKMIENFNIPLKVENSHYTPTANCNLGDKILIVGNEVYVTHWDDDSENLYALSTLSVEFVEINTKLFEPLLRCKEQV